ncbi:hypothetical protein V498_10196, partial [Pseudogymnoascus sp. VKM F-4517 (FW-2822)]
MGSMPPHEFTPGRIACVWTFSEDRQTMQRSSIDRLREDLITPDIPGSKGIRVFVKSRKIVVIARFIDHYLALPIFTHKGAGLDSKIEMKGEYVSIQNRPGFGYNAQPETEHGCLYTTTTAKDAGKKAISAHANVWFTYPLSQPYRNMVTFLGELDPESVSKLCELYLTGTKFALSNTLNNVHHSWWSNARYSLGSEKLQYLAEEAEAEEQRRQANTTQPVNKAFSAPAQEQTYSGALTRQTISGTKTGETPRNTTGFQPLKRPQPSGSSNEVSGGPSKRARG